MVFKHGRIWEFNKNDKKFYKFQILKLISLVIDMILILIPQILFYLFLPVSIEMLGLASFVWGFMYMNFCLILFNNSFGMFITRITIAHKMGFMLNKMQLNIRSLIFGIYSLPIIGWALLSVTFISELAFKGISPNDFISGTTTITVEFDKRLKNFEKREGIIEKGHDDF